MLYIYSSVTPNAQNLYYYFSTLSKFQNELSANLLTTITSDNYRINNDRARIAVNSTITIANTDTITYIIDTNGSYYRCYFVDSANYQSSCIDLELHIDLWGSYFAKCTLSDINILNSNRVLTTAVDAETGILPEIKATDSQFSTKIYFNTTGYIIIFGVSFTTKNSLIFSSTNTNNIALFSVENTTTGFNTLNNITNIISNIVRVNGYNTDATAVSLYVIPKNLFGTLSKATTTTEITYNDGTGTEQTFNAYLMYGGTYSTVSNIDITEDTPVTNILNWECYAGPKTNPFKITKTTNRYWHISYVLNVGSESIQLIIGEGSRTQDITQQVSIPLVRSPQTTAIQDLTNTLSGGLSIASGIVNLVAGNYIGGTSAIASGFDQFANTDTTRRKIVGGGNALATYKNDFSGSLFYLMCYPAITPQNDLIDYNGAIYNNYIDDLTTIFNNPTITGNTLDYTFIRANIVVNNINTMARDYIMNKFNQGIHIKYLT